MKKPLRIPTDLAAIRVWAGTQTSACRVIWQLIDSTARFYCARESARTSRQRGDGSAYFANINGAGRIQLGNFIDASSWKTLETELDPVTNPVVLEFEVVGDTLTASAWDASGARPASPPSVTVTEDIARPLGLMGLNVGRLSSNPVGGGFSFLSESLRCFRQNYPKLGDAWRRWR